MGLCGSKAPPQPVVDDRQRQVEREGTRKLDDKLHRDHQDERMVNKLLLLGAGGSGKSTLFKQMISIYGKGFPEEERKTYTNIIFNNIINSIQTLIEQSPRFGPISAANADSRRLVEEVKEGEDLTPDIGEHIARLWSDPGIIRTYEQRSNFQLNDSTRYFLDRIQDIAVHNYIPSEQDVLRSRVPTTGIVENEFVIESNVFRMFDVGGQRSERKKWIHCFENVTAVLFVSAISEFDQVLYEDDTTHRLEESLTLFDEICNSRWFRDTAIILFLNKRDLFKEKLEAGIKLRDYVVDYKGDNSYKDASEFLKNKFLRLNRNDKTIYSHITCATDRSNISVVFNSVKEIVIEKGLREGGLL